MNENNPKIHRPTKQILSTDKNDLPDRQKRICRTTKYNSWTDIDEASGGLVTSMTYIVLFVNDQVYNAALELKDAIRKTPTGGTSRRSMPTSLKST